MLSNFAVIFDMDGVVIDTEPLYTKAEIRLFGEYGVEIPKEDWPLFRGCAEKDFFDLSMTRYNISEDKNVFIEKGRKYTDLKTKVIHMHIYLKVMILPVSTFWMFI